MAAAALRQELANAQGGGGGGLKSKTSRTLAVSMAGGEGREVGKRGCGRKSLGTARARSVLLVVVCGICSEQDWR
jgi:hypothetical protein